jgi:hypothetical protein
MPRTVSRLSAAIRGIELSNVSVEVSGHDAMAKEFEQFIFVSARLWR